MVLKAGWLPKGPNGEKWGPDEALAYGKTIDDLDSYCHPVAGDEERYLDWPIWARRPTTGSSARS